MCEKTTRSGASISRRTFLKQSGAGVTALVMATMLSSRVQAGSVDSDTGEQSGILIDLTRCTGCQSCALACQVANDRPRSATPPTCLSADSYSFVDGCTVTQDDSEEHCITVSVKRQCMHCDHPACVSACTVGALRKTAQGPVVYDSAKCIGCRYCQYACPFGVPAYDWDNPLGLIHKCQMCTQRQAEGGLPACVQACPNGALRAGPRSALLAQARAQIASNPERYVSHIYGEREAGGTSVLYLSAIPFDQLGFPTLGPEPIPIHAEAVMERTPLIALTVATVATTIHAITRNRGREEQVHFDPEPEIALEAPGDEESGADADKSGGNA